MKIAIHHRINSFSTQWIEYCKKNEISFKLVDCYSSDIIDQLSDCESLMWHWHHADAKAILFARQLIYSLEIIGIKVFPDSNTCWHFDDKIGQKYLLESINVPIVKSIVFYDKDSALLWANKTTYPKVFKLRGGAGSINVKLVKTEKQAQQLIQKSFTRGFSKVNRKTLFLDQFTSFRHQSNVNNLWKLTKSFGRLFLKTDFESKTVKDKGYVYFQDFIPNNTFDIRVIVIGKRAFAIKRNCRVGDFRASGSGFIEYDKDLFDIKCIQISFSVTLKLHAQCLAFDFVFDKDSKPLIIEISYGFSSIGYVHCPGYWDNNLNWHQGKFSPENFMIEDIVSSIEK